VHRGDEEKLRVSMAAYTLFTGRASEKTETRNLENSSAYGKSMPQKVQRPGASDTVE